MSDQEDRCSVGDGGVPHFCKTGHGLYLAAELGGSLREFTAHFYECSIGTPFPVDRIPTNAVWRRTVVRTGREGRADDADRLVNDPFDSILKEMSELHARKSIDYGRTDDPYANVAASTDFGIPAWVGAMVRANDKVRRIQKAAAQATAGESVSLANEGIEDSLLDLATYAIIALVLYRREEV